jgi:hypothetical protein
MANTFKVKTFDGSSTSANAAMNVYTAPASTTTVVIGLTIANTTSSQILVDIKLAAGSTVFLAKDIPIPAASSFEYMAGNKIVMEAGHTISVVSDTANSADSTLSIMEIT